MTRSLFLCLLISLSPALLCADDARLKFFESRIRPVLAEHCYACHASDAANIRGGLLLDSKVGVLTGGESGPVIDREDPEASLLISSLRHESFEMPPDRRLPESIVEDFVTWIRDGAYDPREGGQKLQRRRIDLQQGRQFWSFQPIRRPDIPSGHHRKAIDHFVATRREQANLPDPPSATSVETVRRLYFTLVGLPPSPLQVQQFEKRWLDSPQQAVEELTEQLLASPQFGERWGRHWLDVTRFAESSGGGRSLMFPDAWRFRNYVIESFNTDKPINQFFREHIAGDLLPADSDAQFDDQLTGTGYLALGPTNYELQDKQLLEMEVVDEQIDTMGRTFLGLTIGCARCHDHKFDPIPTADYYALAGIFRSTESLTSGNVSGFVTTALRSGADADAVARWQADVDRQQREIEQLKSQLGQSAEVARFLTRSSLPGIIVDDEDAEFEGDWVHSTVLAPFVDRGYRHDNFRKTGCRVRFEAQLPGGEYEVRLCHNYVQGRCNRLPLVIHHADGTTTVEIDQSAAPADRVFKSLGRFRFRSDERAVVTIDAEQSGPGVVIVDALQFLPTRSAPAESVAQDLRQQLQIAEKSLKALRKQKPAVPQVMSVRETAAPADDHIRIRGAVRNRGNQVPRGVISVACEFDASGRPQQPQITDGSGRRELAAWIVDPTNPLTARVFVNRVWLQLIGEGLVRTPDNFGSMGQRPTHPELLDYLAWSFIHDDQWSVKSLIRRIVTTDTFRQSSTVPQAVLSADPDNRLLTRGFRRRADAEFLRDALLQVSGQLDLSMPDRTIEKLTQYDNGYDHRLSGRRHRSVYVPRFRNSMLELFLVFDVANPNLVTGRRNTSTLPAQALFMLNSPEIRNDAQAAAAEFLRQSSGSALSQQVVDLYLTCLGRYPTPSEAEAVQTYVRQSADTAAQTWEAVFQALFASVDFRYID